MVRYLIGPFLGCAVLMVVCASLQAQEQPASEKTVQRGTDWIDDVPQAEPIDPIPRAEMQSSIDKGVAFLLDFQNEDGSWGSATRTKGLNIYAPIPGAHHGFRAAVTSLCVSALIETGGDDPKVQDAIDKGEAWLFANLLRVRRATGDAMYNVWAHCYALEALAKLHDRAGDDKEKLATIGKMVDDQFLKLEKYESVDGGWGYYDFRYQTRKPSSSSISFVNAAVLVSFDEIKQAGYNPPEKLVNRAIKATERQQLAGYSYLYGEYLKYQPARGINRPGGSLGRSQACNLALRLWGDDDITGEVVTAWQNRLYARNGWLDIGRKRPIPHEAWFSVAGYFYYFGHYYAAKSFYLVPDKQDRTLFQTHMAKLMLDRQEKDGSWWDYPFYNYHQPYGTAFALMTLQRCLPAGSE
ncbi:MAG: terpene cyclase/mutase family protein [Planctomycetaceae bacterium]|nr:terpene cyclase/mutase family protein [Planctomycetaceae bacterium]